MAAGRTVSFTRQPLCLPLLMAAVSFVMQTTLRMVLPNKATADLSRVCMALAAEPEALASVKAMSECLRDG